jgi:aspartate kinase
MERAVVHGIRISLGIAGITVAPVPHTPGAAARLFRAVAAVGVSVGAIAQHPVSATHAAVVFTVARDEAATVVSAVRAAGFPAVAAPLAEVALTGIAMRTDGAVPVIFSEALAMGGVPLTLVSIENHRLTVRCAEPVVDVAVRALCEVFEVPDYRPTTAMPTELPTELPTVMPR